MSAPFLTHNALTAPIAAFAFDDILKRLAQLKFRFNQGFDMPLLRVDLLLQGGMRLSGIVMDYTEGTVLLLHRTEVTDSDRLVYIPAHGICAVSVEYREESIDYLNIKRVLPEQELLGKLRLLRLLQEKGEQAGAALGIPLTLAVAAELLAQESNYRFIAILATDIAEFLQSMAADRMARDALAGTLQSVMIQGADTIKLQWGDNGQLLCLCQVAHGGAGRLSKKAMREQLEKLL